MKKIVCILMLLCLTFGFAFAYSYYIQDADINIAVGKNAVHSIQEEYTFNFATPHHGFYRYIPYNYENAHAVISDFKCNDVFSTEKEDGFFVVKIGSSSREMVGLTDYGLSYTYDLGADRNDGYDEFYINIIGSDWEVPIENAKFNVFVPCRPDDVKIWLTTGYYGSTSKLPYSVEKTSDGILITGRARNLNPYQAVTLRLQFEDNWYAGAREPWDYRGVFKILNPVLSILILGLAAILWMRYGHDNIPVVTARYNPPENLDPLAVGYLVDNEVNDKDLTSMFFYWADKGYLTIEEYKKNKFTLTKKDDLPSSSPKYEQTLFYGLFKHADSVSVDDLQAQNFYEVLLEVRVLVHAYFRKERALISGKSKALCALFTILSLVPGMLLVLTQSAWEYPCDTCAPMLVLNLLAIGFLNVLFCALFEKWYARKTNSVFIIFITLVCVLFGLGMYLLYSICSEPLLIQIAVSVICACGTALFAQIMPRRSEYGHRVFEEVLGYREFIDMVSMAQLVTMIDEDPEYYYHVLSYAIVLGLENKWAKKFESVTTPRPVWYRGISPFDVYLCTRMNTQMILALKTASVPPQSKRSGHIGGVGGGFNIGGFAGGGFGGGGGRAW